jgi:hemin uptake protein HemP
MRGAGNFAHVDSQRGGWNKCQNIGAHESVMNDHVGAVYQLRRAQGQ